MSIPIPAVGEIIIVSFEYDPTGLKWVRLWDNHALGWLVSDAAPAADAPSRSTSHSGGKPGSTRAEREAAPEPGPMKPVTTGEHAPLPIILGSLAKLAPDSAPVVSPQWGKYDEPVIFLPDTGRLELAEFLTWLATNNGANRRIGSMVALSKSLANGLQQWGTMHPDLAFVGEPQSQPPVTVDVPVILPEVATVGDTLTCTMGNWDGMQGEPATYAYTWYSDGEAEIGAESSYVVVSTDIGTSITCVVTATNMAGETDAPPSNAATVVDATPTAAAAEAPELAEHSSAQSKPEKEEVAEQRHSRRR